MKPMHKDIKIYRNYIGGAWMESPARRHAPNINPADASDLIGEAPLSLNDEAMAAIEVAVHALRSWRRTPAPERGALALRAAHLLAERADNVARAVVREQGKTLAEARAEVQRAIAYAEFCGAAAFATEGVTVPLRAPALGYTRRRPLGVVALLTPEWSPLALPFERLVQALVCGNTVVLKPALATPETAEWLVRCFADAGAPSGVVNLVHGATDETGAALIDHPMVRAVWIGGSHADVVGARRQAETRTLRFMSEQMDVNPVIVLEDADLDLALAGVLTGAFGNAGQSYTATKRVILVHPVADAFLEELVARVCALNLGNGLDEAVGIGPCTDEAQIEQALDLVHQAEAEGAEVLCGGARAEDEALAHGYFLRPTIVDRVRPEMRIAREPALGPVLAVTRVESFAEALAHTIRSHAVRAAGIYTRDGARMLRFVEEMNAQSIHINAPTTGDEPQMPVNHDSLIDFFSDTSAVYVQYGAGNGGVV
ncbi:aldehyde dehydrogenase [Roseiflexus castenholzii DSM 13941]|uniref:Aldehyde dehydrogenase n=2 Tax=Roseiflexus castenholzii TaxID=120962 RepID=A7NFF7_ROSCS|nr:aldehyde dehydrogenase [Roseiflexus castenholzii DSM 13941]